LGYGRQAISSPFGLRTAGHFFAIWATDGKPFLRHLGYGWQAISSPFGLRMASHCLNKKIFLLGAKDALRSSNPSLAAMKKYNWRRRALTI